MIAIVRQFRQSGLNFGRSGNVSVRTRHGFLITPSGIAYEEMNARDIVELDFAGNVLAGSLKPSSEWHMHRAIYRKRNDVNAIVHVHSPYATGIACTRKAVPAFHYMVTVLGGDSIPCARYATFGTEKLARNAVTALSHLKACLLANHGQIAVGEDLAAAFRYAGEVENLAKQYYISLQTGGPVLLDKEEMKINIKKFRTYGRQN
jgi:Ribulose-5-phosphate 4-epimerase and related epimerases and aldolases